MHIAVILPRWVGDLVMSTPMIRAVRQHYGDRARLTAVVKPRYAEIFDGTNWFDGIIPYDRRSREGGNRFAAAAAVLRADPVDIALLVPNSLSSAALAWWGGCRRRVGYARHGRRLLLTDPLFPPRRGWQIEPLSTTQHAMDLAERIGVPPQPLRLELATTAADEALLEGVLTRLFPAWATGPDAPLFVFNDNSAYGPAKAWGGNRLAALAKKVLDAFPDGRVVVHCGPGDREEARAVVAAAGDPRVGSLADEATLPFGLSKALLRRAAVVVTTDSGPRHIAAAFATPTVVLHGPMDPRLGMSDHRHLVELRRDLPCSPCGRRTCPLHHHDCMVGLTVDDVASATLGLLAETMSAHRPAPENV